MVDEIWRWTQVADIGPSPRALHSMVYNSSSNKVVLFGGFDNDGPFNDTWEWDGIQWTQVANVGPSVRSYQSMVYDFSKKEIILFGGSDDYFVTGLVFGDTWIMKNHVWGKVSDMGPPPSAIGSMVYTGTRVGTFWRCGYFKRV